jgi:hypothetical protein
VDDEPDLPSFNTWMEGTSADHPLNHRGIPREFLVVWDDLLRPIEIAQSLRIARKKDAFRKIQTFSQCMEQRAELLAASLLAHADIAFEFGADHPDLVLGGQGCGIEVGTRVIDDLRALHDEIEGRAQGLTGLQIILTFDGRPLKIGANRLIEIANEVVASATGGTGNLRFESVGLTVGIATAPFDEVHVSMSGQKLGSELGPHMAEIEREVDNKIAEKRRQAEKMPTVLLLDISRVGDSFLRSPDVWSQVLNSKLKGEPFVGLGVMVSSLDRWLPSQISFVIGDDAPKAMTQAFNRLCEVFGFKFTNLG